MNFGGAAVLVSGTGVLTVIGGAGTATKTTVEELLRRHIEKQLKEKSISEWIDLSRKLT